MSQTYTSRGTETHKGLALLVLGISQLMIILDATIVNVALNHIAIDFGVFDETGAVDFAQIQWIVTGYALTFGGVLLLGGKLADRLGRRRIFMAGLVLFGFASLLGGFANSLGVLIAARALQGIGGAMLAPAALSLLTVVFEEGKERDRAFGVWAGISAGGAAIGLILGGLLTEKLDDVLVLGGNPVEGWRWVFFVNVPIALFALWGTLRFVPESKDENAKGFDVIGAVLITAGLAALVYGLANANDPLVATGTKIAFIGGAAVLIAAFFVWEGVIKQPLLPLRLFKFRNLTGSNIGGLFVGAGLFSSFLYLVFWMQQINGWEPLKSGFAFLPFTVGIIIGAAFSSVMIGRLGPRPLVTIGPFIAGTGMLMLGLFLEPDSSYLGLVLPAQLVISIGMGVTFPALVSGAVSGVPQENAGIASALLNAAQQVGGAVGVALLTAISIGRTNSLLTANPPVPTPEMMAAAAAAPDPAAATALAMQQAAFPAIVDGWGAALTVGAVLIYLAGIIMGSIVRAKPGAMPKMAMA
ncbi:MAG: MFS transporter [Bauldia sp.]|nr:MFS transporter [Bauldia sp.]MCW5717306.1 MFS transporter [Bauldia sp.]